MNLKSGNVAHPSQQRFLHWFLWVISTSWKEKGVRSLGESAWLVARIIRVILTPRGWLLKTHLPSGAIVYGKNVAGFGGRGIYLKRDAIEPEFEHLEKFLVPGGVLIDIGANTGIYTLKAAQFFSKNGGTVIAVEPFLDVLATLFKSVQVNRYSNVRLRNACISGNTCTAKLWRNFNRPHSFSLLQCDQQAQCLSVLSLTLDDLFKWEELDRLDYLKLDVEGVEEQVLQGGKNTIRKYRPIIQLEITLSDAALDLQNYSVFEAPGSPNKFCIPNEHPEIDIPNQIGWRLVQTAESSPAGVG